MAKTEVKEVKAKFDKKAFSDKIIKAFKNSKDVDVVADTDREQSINKDEYEYIHFYKKETENNLFQLYVKNKDCKFVVGLTLADFLSEGEEYVITPVEKKRGEEKKVAYIRITCEHDKAVDVAKMIIAAYKAKIKVQAVETPKEK